MGTPRHYTPDEDAPLLAPLQQGDRVAFEALTRKYLKRMFNLVFLLSGDAACATEASRNAFAAAWREVKSLRSTMHFSTWLVVLMLREYRHLLDFVAEGEACAAASAGGTDVTGGRTDTPLQRDLRRYVRSLAPEQATVLVLHYVRGYSLERIAGILQIREDVLLSRLFLAQEQLSALLRQGTDVSGRSGGEEQAPHAEVRHGFSAYLDNSASDADKERIMRHLGGCGSCREALAQLEWIAEHLKTLPDVEPPAWLVPAIMDAARTDIPPLPPPPPGYNLFSHGKLALVALIVAAVSLYWYLALREEGDRTQRAVPAASARVETPPAGENRAVGPKGLLAPPPALPRQSGGAPAVAPPRAEATGVPASPLPAPALPALPVPRGPTQRQAAGSKQSAPPASPRAETTPILPADWGESPTVVRQTPRKAATPKGHGSETAVVLRVSDNDGAQGEIERAVTDLGGTITGRGYSGGRAMLYTRIEADAVMDLMGGLGKIGTLLELPHIPEGSAGVIDLTITWSM
jgi:RNA polymerase sigma-70 factor (ECF subfamily)